MRIGNPNSRYKLRIDRKAKVLDVGSGHNPHPRANVIIDKFTDTNFHRSGNIKVLKNQQFVNADGERMPFSDKEFDYVICAHVLEHVDNPSQFLTELSRVGRGGYLETPSLIGEFLIPKLSHKHVIMDLDDKVVVVDKQRLGFSFSPDFGEVFQEFLPKNSFGFKILQRTHHELFTVNYEWKDSIDYIIDPSDEDLMMFFNATWDKQMVDEVMPQRGLFREFTTSLSAAAEIALSVFKSRVLKS